MQIGGLPKHGHFDSGRGVGGGASSLPPVAPLPLSRRATNLGKAIVQIAPPPFSRASVYSTVRVLK